jgi:hypothetical protein
MRVARAAAVVLVFALLLTACGYQYMTRWAPSSLANSLVAQMESNGWELVSQTEVPNADTRDCCSATEPYHELVFRKRKARVD